MSFLRTSKAAMPKRRKLPALVLAFLFWEGDEDGCYEQRGGAGRLGGVSSRLFGGFRDDATKIRAMKTAAGLRPRRENGRKVRRG